jgi:hypothetical protein
MGRIADLVVSGPASAMQRSRPRLSLADERLMRDADEAQLGKAGVQIASVGTKDQWRAFIRDHVRHRFDLMVLFDATSTSVK